MDREELHNIFARNLVNRMAENKINQTELAKRVGVSGAQVTAWVQGVHMPRSNHLATLTEIFNCQPSDLLQEEKRPHQAGEAPPGYEILSPEKKAIVDALILQLAKEQ